MLSLYIHNFGDLPEDEISPEAKVLDWSAHFDRDSTPRKVPSHSVWDKTLLPDLRQCRADFKQRGQVQLGTTGALSVGFAFGATFQEVGHYQLEVNQTPPKPPQIWRSDADQPSDRDQPELNSYQMVGNPTAKDAVVIISAVPNRPAQSVAHAVGKYWDEADVFGDFWSTSKPTVGYNISAIRQVLINGFSDTELRTLCFDHPDFRTVYDSLAEISGKTAIVQRIIEYSERQLLFEMLLDVIKTHNPRRYAQHEAEFVQTQVKSRKFKGVLFLEAQAAAQDNRFIEAWEAVALARISRGMVLDFVSRVDPQTTHLFLATPFGLAVFLGHYWNALNSVIQCHEFVGGPDNYAPSCRLNL